MRIDDNVRRDFKVLAIDDHPITIDGLRLCLECININTQLHAASDMEHAIIRLVDHDDFSLVLLDLQVDRVKSFELISLVRSRHQRLPVVVFSAEEDVAIIRSAFDAGVSGYIPKRSSGEILVGALRLILAGGTYIPPTVLSNLRKKGPVTTGFKLTAREAEILPLLALGMSNKLISRRLAIAESTTKTHVSAIMRTLQVKNRTEVSALVGQLK